MLPTQQQLGHDFNMNVCVVYLYIYIYREREREGGGEPSSPSIIPFMDCHWTGAHQYPSHGRLSRGNFASLSLRLLDWGRTLWDMI